MGRRESYPGCGRIALSLGAALFLAAALGGGAAWAGAAAGAPGGAKPAAPAGKGGGKAPPSGAVGARRLSDRLLQELEVKRRELAQRERDIRREETRLNELRADIKKRIVALQDLEKRVQGALKKVETASDERLDHLVKAYSAMGPDEAAVLMNTMNITLAVRILRNMQVKKAGTILAVVEPRKAARISEMLARFTPPPEPAKKRAQAAN